MAFMLASLSKNSLLHFFILKHNMSFLRDSKVRKEEIRKWATYSDLSVESSEDKNQTWNVFFKLIKMFNIDENKH